MKLKWTLFIVIIILWMFGTIGLSINIYQKTSINQMLETIKTIFLCIGALGVLLPTYLNIWQSLENSKTLEERIMFDRIENTFKLMEQWDNPLLFEARNLTREMREHRESISNIELLNKIKDNKKLEQSIVLVFNYFDRIRISIETNRVNKDLIVSCLGEVIIDMTKRFEPWINQQSAENKKDFDKLIELMKG